MNIAWFTPFSVNSAIGKCSFEVVSVLSRTESVEILCFDQGDTFDIHVPVRRYPSASSIDASIASKYDIAVYSFGNYIPFHLDIFEMSQRWPGIAIMHDFVLHHFFAGYYLEHLRDPSLYVESLERHHGGRGRSAALESLRPSGTRVWETDAVSEFPLFQQALSGAMGAVVHSDFFKLSVEEYFGGPVCKIPLPFTVDRTSPVLSRGELGLPEDRLLILTVGHANPNKRILATVESLSTLASDPGQFHFVIAGPCADNYAEEIRSAASRGGIAGSVRITGRLPDLEMRSYLAHADICVNLRYPVTEGASGSAVEEMLFGKPMIVGDIGSFAELPDESVLKIDPLSFDELRGALKRLLKNEKERRRLGKAAQDFALPRHQPETYASKFLDFVREVRLARPLLSLTDRLGTECARMGIARGMGVIERLSHELNTLFGSPE